MIRGRTFYEAVMARRITEYQVGEFMDVFIPVR
jgi:hypothetical protein